MNSPAASAHEVLKVEGLSKKFQAMALHDVSFTLQKGESLALVGANGAGKSTLIKIILGLMRASSGGGHLFGFPFDDARASEKIGYLPELPGYWGELSARELLHFMGIIRDIPTKDSQSRVEKLLQALGLNLRGSRLMGGYSKGMLQRTGIAQCLMHDPELIILDEPMSGLDPRAQEKLRQILQSLRAQGKTLIISSHHLEDIRTLCTRVIVLEKSKVVLDGPTDLVLNQLVEKYRSSEPWDEDPLGDWPNAL
jgi:ABC-2 type transport system ATP-binding protein